MNRARNADHAARTCERFVYSIVKISRFYDYQAGRPFVEKFTGCAKVCGLFKGNSDHVVCSCFLHFADCVRVHDLLAQERTEHPPHYVAVLLHFCRRRSSVI